MGNQNEEPSVTPQKTPWELWDTLPKEIPADIQEETWKRENPDFEFEFWGMVDPDFEEIGSERDLIWRCFVDSNAWPRVRDEFVEGLVYFHLAGEETWLRVAQEAGTKEDFLYLLLEHPIASRLRSVRKALMESGSERIVEDMVGSTDAKEMPELFNAYVEYVGEVGLDWLARTCPPECLEVLTREQWSLLAEAAPQEAFGALTSTARAHEGMRLEYIVSAFAYLVHQDGRLAAEFLLSCPESIARYLEPGSLRQLWEMLAREDGQEAFKALLPTGEGHEVEQEAVGREGREGREGSEGSERRKEGGSVRRAEKRIMLYEEVGQMEVGQILDEEPRLLDIFLTTTGSYALEIAGEENLRRAWGALLMERPREAMDVLEIFPQHLHKILSPVDLAPACNSSEAKIRMRAITALPLLKSVEERGASQKELSMSTFQR